MYKILFSTFMFIGMNSAFGGGFQLNLQGLQQLAMGGSGTAYPWDASTIFYNPGGLSRLDGFQLSGSMLMIMPNIKYVQLPTGGYSYSTVQQVFTPFNFYAGGLIKKNSKIGLGLGIYTPFGSGTKWEDNWVGRFISQDIKLQSIFFQPTVSYLINDKISLGIGFVYALGSISLSRALPVEDLSGMEGNAHLKGNAHGLGFNIGLSFKASERFNLGLSYRSKVKMKLKNGNADFSVPSSLISAFPDTKFNATLPLPEVLSLGASYKVSNKLILQSDLEFVGWKAYDTLKFDYKENTNILKDTHTPRLYKNTLTFRLGVHYQFTENVAGMLGGAYDPTPVRDDFVSPDLPDANRFIGSLGLSYSPITQLKILFAVELLTTSKRDGNFEPENFSGTYQSKAFTCGLGLNYHF